MRILSCTCSFLIFLGAFILQSPNANASDSSEPLSQKSSIQVTVLSRQTYEIPTNSLGGISSLEFDLGFSEGGSVSSIFLSSSTSNLSPSSSTVGGTVANNAICTISEEPAHLIPLHVFGITARIASNLLKISRSEFEIYYFYLDTTLSLSIYRVGNSEQTTFKHIGKKPVDFGGMFEFKIDPNNTLDLSIGSRSTMTTQSKSQNVDNDNNTSGNDKNSQSSQQSTQSKDKYVRFLKLLQWREELLCVIDNVLFLFNQDKAELLLDLPAYPYSVEILGDMLIITCSDSGEIFVYSIGFINSTTTTTTNSKPTSDMISIKKVQKINKKVLAFEQIQVLYDRVYVSNSRVIHVYLTTPDNVLAQACRIDVLTSQDQVIESIYANKDVLVAVVAVLDQSDKSLVKSREIREFLVKRSFLESQSHPSQVACFKQVKSDIHRSLPMNQKQQSRNSAIFDDSHIYYVSKHGMLAIRKGIPDVLLVGDSRNVWELRYDSLNMQRIESVQAESPTTAKTTKQSGGLFIVASSTVISLLRVHRSDPILKCDARRLLERRGSSLDDSLVNSGSVNNNRRNSVEMKLVFSSLNCEESTSRSSGSAQQEIRSNDGLFSLAMRSVEGAGCVFEQDLRVYAVPFEVNSTKDEEDFLFGISLAGCVGVLCFAAFMFCQSRYVESGAGSNTASSGRVKKGESDKQKILPQQNRKINFLNRFRKGSQGNDLESDDLSSSNVNVNRTPSSASTSSSSSKKKRNSSVEMNSSAQILVGTRQSKRKLLNNGNTPSSSSNGGASVSISTTTHGVESEEDEEQGISKLFSTKAALADSVLTPEEKEAIIITKSKEHQKYLQQVLQDDEFLKLPQEEQDEFLHEQYQFHLDFQRQLKLQNIQRTGGGNAVVIKRGKNSQAKPRDVPVHEKFAEKVDAILETESDKKASTRRGEETLYRMQRRSKLMEHNRNSNWNKFNEWRDEKSNNDRSGRNAAAAGGGVAAAAANASVISQGNQDIVRTGIPLMTLQSIQKSLAQEKGNREEIDGDVIYVNGNGGIIDAAGVYHNGFDENEDGRDDGDDDDDDEDITNINGNVVAGENANSDYQNVYEEEEDDNHGAETKASESQPQSAQSAPQVSRSSNSEIGSNRISGVRKSSNEQVSMSQQEERQVDDLEINRKLGGDGGEEKSQVNEEGEEEKQGGIHSDSLEEDADDQSLSL